MPVLLEHWLRRKATTAHRTHRWRIGTVVTHSCSKIVHEFDPVRFGIGVEWHVRTAVVAKEAHAVLVVVDADDHHAPALRESLAARVKAFAPHVPSAVVVANREYEAWFLADMWSLRRRGLFPAANRLATLFPPESKRGAKGYVGELLGRPYIEVEDQATLSGALSLNAGQRRRSPSFRKLETELSRLTREARRRANAR